MTDRTYSFTRSYQSSSHCCAAAASSCSLLPLVDTAVVLVVSIFLLCLRIMLPI